MRFSLCTDRPTCSLYQNATLAAVRWTFKLSPNIREKKLVVCRDYIGDTLVFGVAMRPESCTLHNKAHCTRLTLPIPKMYAKQTRAKYIYNRCINSTTGRLTFRFIVFYFIETSLCSTTTVFDILF